MKIIVDGATSMIAVALIKECINTHYEVVAIAREQSSNIYRIPQSNFVKIVTTSNVNKINPIGYDAYYHFAWKGTSKKLRQDLQTQLENIELTLASLELANKLGCKYFVGAGSQAEYGIVSGKISETCIPHPETYYGISKLSSYLFVKGYCEKAGIKYIWPRIFSVYGTNDTKQSMISYVLDCYLNNEKAVFSKADNIWNFLFEEDAAKLLLSLVKNSAKSGIYNIANPNSKLLKDYINELADVLGKYFNFEFSEKSSPISLDVDMKKTLEASGVHSFVSFKDGIKTILKRSKMNA